jgi:hypothetical protein
VNLTELHFENYVISLIAPDYILELRKSISGAEDTKPVLTDQFFDSVRHWQNAYQKSELEQIKLHNTIFELKQKNEALLAKLKAETPPAKRKVFAEVENEPEPRSKRRNPRGLGYQPQRDNEGQGQDENQDPQAENGMCLH